ncbi:von Willebrand factor type A domain [Haematococcus lacustris]|uniref:von Willebrand factor type A domain n=1 Tax=Haematococcus lacustris TaxID=44745 RepID=A0A699ZQF8_HAELA|nr:von Willebrand factor type A domain [Haematococcus lacustris]
MMQRCSAVTQAACGFLAQQIADRPGPRDTCSLITFNDAARIVFQGQRVDDSATAAIRRAESATGCTTYANALSRATELIKTQPADLHCVVFLSDGEDNHPTDALLQRGVDGLIAACKPGQLIFHALGFGPPGSTFVWLRKMAAAALGTYHRSISSQFSSRRNNAFPVAASKAIPTSSPSVMMPTFGSLLQWNATTQDWDLLKQGLTLFITMPHFAAGASRRAHHVSRTSQLPRLAPPGARDMAPAGPLPSSPVARPDQLVEGKLVAKESIHRTSEAEVRYLSIEPFLEGSYTKFNGNEGYVAALPDDAAGGLA